MAPLLLSIFDSGISQIDRTHIAYGQLSNAASTTITPRPTADNQNILTNSGAPIQLTLTGTDPIPGDVLKFSVVALAQHGTLTSGTTSNSVAYTPSTGFSGSDSFTYKAIDGQGVNSNTATVTITVNATPPIANAVATQSTSGSNVWSGFGTLGGNLLGDPAVARNSDGRLEVFVIGADHALYHKSQILAGGSSGWIGYSTLGGNLISNPVVAKNPDGRLEVFVIGADHSLLHASQLTAGSTSWSGFTSLGGYIISNPAVARNSDGRLEVFVIGSNHALYHKYQLAAGSTNSWSGYTSLGGYIISNPVAGQNSDGRLEVFVIGSDHALYHIFELAASSSNSWSGFRSLGGYIISDPAIASNSDGRLEVFVIESDHGLYHIFELAASSSNSWSGYAYLGGSILGNTNPAAALNSQGQLQAFVVGANNSILYKFQITPGSSSWTGYAGLGGFVISNPVVAKNADSRLELFVIEGDHALYHNFQLSSVSSGTPTANNINIQTNAGTPIQITLTGTDPIAGDVLKFSVVNIPQHGTITSGTTSDSVTYTPNSGFSGSDSFTYKATDGQGVDSNIATVTITVNAPPTPPTANNINIQTNSGTPVQITLTGTDPIPGDVLKFSVVGNPQHGTVTPGTVSSIVFYTPNTGFIGTDSFTYKATDGQGVDSNIATVTITVSSSSTGTVDQFGITELYPSKANGEHYNMNMQSESNDPQFDPNGNTLTKNADGTYNVQSSSVRLQIFTSTGFQENQIKTLNQVQLASQGYMLRPNDWKNVEITGYLKPNHFTTSTTNGAAHIEYVARGARNTNDNYLVGGFSAQCEATTYHSNTYMTGRVKFEKDLMHTAGYTANSQDPQILSAVNMALGKWVGIKAVYYNFPNGTVKLEQWVDDSTDNINAPGNKWHKVLEFTDHGQWGGGQPNCGGTPSTIITWGGPIALFRWDNIDNMDFKDFSIREIQAPFG